MHAHTTHASLAVAAILFAGDAAFGQTITVDTHTDTVDIPWSTATVADLPGPDGRISLPEALIASNHTPGVQVIGFAIPQSDWVFQFLFPGCAVIQISNSFFMNATDPVIIDGVTQTLFTGDTNPNGAEVAIYGAELRVNTSGSTVRGFHGSSLSVNGSNNLVTANTNVNISAFGGGGSQFLDNTGGTLKIDRSNDNVVFGNTFQRIRIWGFGASQPATNNRVGGPNPGERNFITGYGTHNSEGLPSGEAIQLFDTVGTIIEGNRIGTTPDGLAQGNLACTMGIRFQGDNQNALVRDNLIAGILGHGAGPHHAGQLFGWAIQVGGTGSAIHVFGNTIGLDANGAPTLGSVYGVDCGDAFADTGITNLRIGGANPGEANVIAGHIFRGVAVGTGAKAARISGNSIRDNGLGIDLIGSFGVNPNDALDADTGANGLQNFPVIQSATRQGGAIRVLGALNSTPSATFTVELFASTSCDASGNGEGEVYLGATSVNTDGLGAAAFDVTLPAPPFAGGVVTATATAEPIGATSEFSACVAIVDDACQTSLGFGGPGAVTLSICGATLDTGNQATLHLAGAPALAPSLFVIGAQANPTPFLGGTLVPLPILTTLILTTQASGELTFPVPGGGGPATVYLQVVVADAGQLFGVALSNALQVDMGS